MKWLIYLFVISVALGLVRRDYRCLDGYISWFLLSVCLAFGVAVME